MKVYHALYNSFEEQDTMYDHANTDTIAGAHTDYDGRPNQKTLEYYTQLNGSRIQNINLDCTSTGPFLDYMHHRRMLRGSIVSNLNVYQYNWFHCDDFSDLGQNMSIIIQESL
jgi:hypothetical protein